MAPILTLKSRLRVVLTLLEGIAYKGPTLNRALELDRQWSAILRDGPVFFFGLGPSSWWFYCWLGRIPQQGGGLWFSDYRIYPAGGFSP